MTAFIHAHAGSYLNDTLGALLSDVIRDPRLQDFSVASNIPPDQREQNIRYIQTVAKKFLDAIVGSTDSLPAYVLLPTTLTLDHCEISFVTSRYAVKNDLASTIHPHLMLALEVLYFCDSSDQQFLFQHHRHI